MTSLAMRSGKFSVFAPRLGSSLRTAKTARAALRWSDTWANLSSAAFQLRIVWRSQARPC